MVYDYEILLCHVSVVDGNVCIVTATKHVTVIAYWLI